MVTKLSTKKQLVLDYLYNALIEAIRTGNYRHETSIRTWIKFVESASDRTPILMAYAEYRETVIATPAQPIQQPLF